MTLLDEQAKQRVSEAIARAEAGTAGEIVVLTIPRSDSYAAPRALFAGTAALGVAMECHQYFLAGPPWLWFLVQIPLSLSLYWLGGLGPVLRLLVPKQILSLAVKNQAAQAFLQAGVCDTRDRSGVLVLVSMAEHRVELLADRGIHERVDVGRWQQDVNALTRALRKSRAEAGLVTLIESLGALLAEHFPPRQDDTNELANEVRHIV